MASALGGGHMSYWGMIGDASVGHRGIGAGVGLQTWGFPQQKARSRGSGGRAEVGDVGTGGGKP